MKHPAESNVPCLCFDFPALPEQVGRARQRVTAFLDAMGWGEDDVQMVALAVGEAGNNAVSYGDHGETALTAHLCCRLTEPGCVQIDVSNQGGDFAPDVSLLSQLPATEDFATHGRGFALMTALMDEVTVSSAGGLTNVRLTKRRTI